MVVVLNLGTSPATVQIPSDPIKGASRLQAAYGSSRTRLESANLFVELHAESATVLLATGEGAFRG